MVTFEELVTSDVFDKYVDVHYQMWNRYSSKITKSFFIGLVKNLIRNRPHTTNYTFDIVPNVLSEITLNDIKVFLDIEDDIHDSYMSLYDKTKLLVKLNGELLETSNYYLDISTLQWYFGLVRNNEDNSKIVYGRTNPYMTRHKQDLVTQCAQKMRATTSIRTEYYDIMDRLENRKIVKRYYKNTNTSVRTKNLVLDFIGKL